MPKNSEIEKLQNEIKFLKEKIDEADSLITSDEDSFKLLNNLNQILFVVDDESNKIVFCNRKFISVFDDYTGKKYWEVFSERGMGDEANQNKCKDNENRQTVFYSKKIKQWYEINTSRIKLSDNKSYILESLTVVSKEEIPAEDNDKKFRLLFNNSPDAIFFIDAATGIIIDTNIAGIKLLNREYEDIIGLKHTEIFPIKIKSDKNNKDQKFDFILTSDRREIPVAVSEKRIIMDNKPLLLVIYRDISEINKYSGQLLKANNKIENIQKAKLEFLANLSHEMRTPLNAILGYSQILLKDTSLSDEQSDFISVIKNSGDFVLSMIDDLMLMAKFESGKKRIKKNPFSLLSLINDINHVIKIKASDKALIYQYELLGNLPDMVVGDKLLLTQVILNLLNNAIKYTNKGKVFFRVGNHDDSIRFQVEDTGIGIPEEFKEEIFIPYSQVGSKYHSEGSGLGLSICKRLIEIMGGELKMKSLSRVGTLFWFDLKLPFIEIQDELPFELEKKIIGYEGTRKKILIVDDDDDNRLMLKRMLQPLDFKLMQASNGIEAINKSKKDTPDLILINLILSGLSGLETTKLLRNEDKLQKVKIIAVSSENEDQYNDDYLAAGCEDIINKPINYEALLDKIEEYLHVEWKFKDDYNSTISGENIIVPPREITRPIYNAIKSGDLELLKKELSIAKEIEKQYIPFFEIIKNLLKNFRIKGLHDFIDKYVGDTNVK
ncbi:MAG: response regulator [Melioribacteraceae bacterium]|nr:response regulator [Melioribacteraceae bacterium]